MYVPLEFTGAKAKVLPTEIVHISPALHKQQVCSVLRFFTIAISSMYLIRQCINVHQINMYKCEPAPSWGFLTSVVFDILQTHLKEFVDD